MRRIILGVTVVACAAAAVPAAASSSTTSSTSALKGFVCQTAAEPAQRAMSVKAVMGHIDGTAKLEMRFQLLKHVKRHGPSATVSGRGLNTWLTPPKPKPGAETLGSRPGDTWIVKKPVVGLAAPAYYRFNVAFRWLDSNGVVISQASHHSQVCFEPQLMPDLKVKKAWASSRSPGGYVVVVGNSGASASTGFTVVITSAVSGVPLAQLTSPSPPLAAHTQATVPLAGAACTPGEQLDITVTPTDPMDDANPSDDTAAATCPAATTAPARTHRGR